MQLFKKSKEEKDDKLERWLISYADFITLMFAFFAVMFALSQADHAKYKAAVESIRRAFHASTLFPARGNIPSTDTEMLRESSEKLRALFENTTGLGLKHGDLEVFRTQKGFKIRLGEAILFKPGGDKLKTEYVPFLYELGKKLKPLGVSVQVEGHTDNSGNESHGNWKLSLNRAYHVVQFFVEGTDFPKNRISIAGFGDSQPIAENDSIEGRQRNRRVEIEVFTENRDLFNPWR